MRGKTGRAFGIFLAQGSSSNLGVLLLALDDQPGGGVLGDSCLFFPALTGDRRRLAVGGSLSACSDDSDDHRTSIRLIS